MSNANQPIRPRLEAGQIIPAFTLPGADGMPHSPWDYKQREHLLLLFTRSSTTSETRGVLRAFAQQYASFREEECAILAIAPDTVIVNLRAQEELHLPFALLADPKGEVIARYLEHTMEPRRADTRFSAPLNSAPAPTDITLYPNILLADRYGALYQHWIAESEADLPSIEELLEFVHYLNKLFTS